jgi:hypothetical protein
LHQDLAVLRIGREPTPGSVFDQPRRPILPGLQRLAHGAAVDVNFGRRALSQGDTVSAQERFAEALILEPRSNAAREGIAQMTLAAR